MVQSLQQRSDAAQRIQEHWKHWHSHGALTTIKQKQQSQEKAGKPGTVSDDFSFFIHGHQEAKISLRPQDLDQLALAIANGNYTAPIFASTFLPQLTLSLFFSNRINYDQTCTILELHQVLADFHLKKFVPLFDADGKFTEEAKSFLLKALYLKVNYGFSQEINMTLDSDQWEYFEEECAEIPKSEKIIYLTDDTCLLGNSLAERLLTARHSILHLAEQGSVIHISASLRRIFGDYIFNSEELESYISASPRLGAFTKDEIEEGIRTKSTRYAFLNYPGISPYPTAEKSIHGHVNFPAFLGTAHDVYHSITHARLSKPVVDIFLRLVDQFRKITGLRWSDEIWFAIDQEFNSDRILIQSTSPSEILCDTVFEGALYSRIFREIKTLLPIADNPGASEVIWSEFLTCFGALVVLDAVTNTAYWIKTGVNPLKFKDNTKLKSSYEDMLNIYPYLKDDSPKIQIFKFQIYQFLSEQQIHLDTRELRDIFSKISARMDEEDFLPLLSKIEFTKARTNDDAALIRKNSVRLMCNGKDVVKKLKKYRLPEIDADDLEEFDPTAFCEMLSQIFL